MSALQLDVSTTSVTSTSDDIVLTMGDHDIEATQAYQMEPDEPKEQPKFAVPAVPPKKAKAKVNNMLKSYIVLAVINVPL